MSFGKPPRPEGKGASPKGRATTGPEAMGPDADLYDADFDPERELAVELCVDGTLDLHTFAPRDARDVVDAYIGACQERGLFELRIIHGKGIGALRETVHAALRRDPRVLSFALAGEGAGGWGATLVTLRRS